MKYIKVLFIAIFIMMFDLLSAQNNMQEKGIMVKVFKINDTIKLRWLPTHIDVWRAGNTYGYNISRMVTHDTMSVAEEFSSREIIADTIRPYIESDWDNMFESNDNADVAKNLLYNDSLKYSVGAADSIKLVDAVNYNSNEEARFMFSLMVGEQDFSVAKGLGLAYEDVNIDTSLTYIYVVKVNVPNNDSLGYEPGVTKFNSAINTLPIPQELEAEGGDRVVLLSWRTIELEEYYSYYNIERKMVGGEFEVINKAPFMYMVDDKAESEYVFYKDSIIDNNTEYVYRVRGISTFGSLSEPSDTVHVFGKEPRLDLQISIDSTNVGDNSIYLEWSVYPDSILNKIEHFDVLMKVRIDDSTAVINNSAIGANDTSYTHTNPVGIGYYIVEAVDINGYNYRSISTLMQLPDTIPPAKPTGLTGSIRDDGKVVINWNENTEEDLEGYKVLYSNEINGEYSQLTSLALVKPHFEDFIDPELMFDSIYFKVFAVDYRYNMSEFSDPLSLERPDIIAPSQPVIRKLVSFKDGIAVFWGLSESNDLVKHELQRKIANTPNWEKVLSFSVGNEPPLTFSLNSMLDSANYVDYDTLTFNMYKYRLLAYDDNGNISYSKEKEVFPFDDGIRGVVSDFEGYLIPYVPVMDYINLTTNFSNVSLPSSTNGLSSSVLNLITANINYNGGSGGNGSTGLNYSVNPPPGLPGQYNLNGYKKAVAFKWNYITDFERNLYSFKLYRRIVFQQGITFGSNSNSGSQSYSDFVLIKTISPEDAQRLASLVNYDGYIFIDDFPQKGVAHYEYMIKSMHSDGGTSEYSPIITIQTFGN